ncbi:MAG: hypothetical protein M1830_010623 [Pleopsidium flavum]|nr:MAG: hypothetical protein M1830_010623 [Pleopsidium flavum]
MQSRKRTTNSAGTYSITRPGPEDEETREDGRKGQSANDGPERPEGGGSGAALHDQMDGDVGRSSALTICGAREDTTRPSILQSLRMSKRGQDPAFAKKTIKLYLMLYIPSSLPPPMPSQA